MSPVMSPVISSRPTHATLLALAMALVLTVTLSLAAQRAQAQAQAQAVAPNASASKTPTVGKPSVKTKTKTKPQVRPDYIYRAKKTDTPEKIAFEFLDRAHEPEVRKRFFAHNKIAPSLSKKPVKEKTPFNIPVAWMYLKSGIATALAVDGVVWARNPDMPSGALYILQANAALKEGTIIKTAPNAFAKISLPDGSVLSIDPDTEVVLDVLKQYASTDIFKINILLNQGRAESKVKPLTSVDSSYNVKSKRLSTGVRGTRFALTERVGGTSSLEVFEGVVAVLTDGKNEWVTPSGFARMAGQLTPSALIELLSKPTWHCQGRSEFAQGKRVTVTLPDNAVQLRVDIYRGKQAMTPGGQPTELRVVPVLPTGFELDLADGDYTIGLRAIDKNGLQSDVGSQAIQVSQKAVPSNAAPNAMTPQHSSQAGPAPTAGAVIKEAQCTPT